MNEKSRVHKNKTGEDRDAHKLEKDQKVREEHVRLLPICQRHISKGIEHLLFLNLDAKREILKHVFNHLEAKSALRVARANIFLQELLSPPTSLKIESEINPIVGNGAGFLV